MPASPANKIILILFAFFALLTISLNLWSLLDSKPDVVVVDAIDQEIKHWQKIADSNPSFRDAYLNLAKLYEQKGELAHAKLMVRKAQEIDPLFEATYEYGAVLGVRSF